MRARLPHRPRLPLPFSLSLGSIPERLGWPARPSRFYSPPPPPPPPPPLDTADAAPTELLEPAAPPPRNREFPDARRSFYRRELPLHLISFTSQLGRRLFKEALDANMVENYFNLVGNFTTQSETSCIDPGPIRSNFLLAVGVDCGLGSLAMVLNALEIDPGRTWKGIWRWYSDEMLECCAPLELIREKGITFEQFCCLAKCHGLEVEANRADQVYSMQRSIAQFEADLRRTATEPGVHMVVSFSRAALGQTGFGHFSPVGAYHARERLALVLDVARFKYPSYWASKDRLWAAMLPADADTGLSRGYVMLRRSRNRITGCS